MTKAHSLVSIAPSATAFALAVVMGCSSPGSQFADNGGTGAGGDEAGGSGQGTGGSESGTGGNQNGSGGAPGEGGETAGGSGGGAGTSSTGGNGSGGSASAGKGGGSGGTPGTGGSGGDAGIHRSQPLKLMPLGDSITQSTCWRARLWEKLQAGGFKGVDFVGGNRNQSCGNPNYDQDNEGHNGYIITQHGANEYDGWFAAHPPDVVAMHMGTNDVWNSISPTQILATFSILVDGARKVSPNVVILAAQIIPLAPAGCTTCPARTTALNAAIPAWAAGKSTAQSPIIVVDLWTGFNSATDTGDGVHPNDTTGSTKMANGYYNALAKILQ